MNNRDEYLLSIKSFWNAYIQLISEEHECGRKRGFAVVRCISAMVDQLVRELFYRACEDTGVDFRQVTENLSLIAVGGYGRRELSPYSDIDLLFLIGRKSWKTEAEKVVQGVLYYLWDMRFDVGHSCMTISQCFDVAKKDIKTLAAIAESRALLGSEFLYTRFQQGLQKHFITASNTKSFIRAKINERNLSLQHFDNSALLLEPDIKENPGGLRDYHLSLWIGRAKFGIEKFKDLVYKDILSYTEWQKYRKAVDTLLYIRAGLHFLKNKKIDMISMEDLSPLSKRLGYTCPKGENEGIENLMRDYYSSARNVQYYSDLVIRKCVKKENKLFATKKYLKDGFYINGGEICLSGDERSLDFSTENSLMLMKAFSYAQNFNLPLNNYLLQEIKSYSENYQPHISEDRNVVKLFFSILQGKRVYETIKSIHYVGLLTSIIPEFNKIDCLVQLDPYHRYTVDEHSLETLKYLERLGSNGGEEEKNISGIYKSVYKELENSVVLKLAALLHDIGKGYEKNKRDGVIHSISWRLGLDVEERETLNFLVDNHLLMNNIAQHHDLHDEKIIRDFSTRVGNVKRLKMLFLITYSDIKAVGHNTWNAWKEALLFELFSRTLNYISFLDTFVDKNFSSYKNEIIKNLQGEISEEVIISHLDLVPKKHLAFISPDKLEWEIKTLQHLKEGDIAFSHRINTDLGCSEFIICSIHDWPGLFLEITGVIAFFNLNILGAQLATRKDGTAVDILQLQTDDGKPIYDEELVESLKKQFDLVREKKVQVRKLVPKAGKFVSPKWKAIRTVPSEVAIDNKTSENYTIVQITTFDRIGLLYTISSVLFHLGLNIAMAKIVTEGERAIDTFYMSFDGGKIRDEEILKLLSLFLRNVLDGNGN